MKHPQVVELQKLPTHDQRSQEWYDNRNKRLTASDAASALEINKYSSREELLFKKCGVFIPFEGNVATKHGQKYEDEAIEEYEKLTGEKVNQFGLINHPTIDCIGGSPDGITDTGIVIEVKCPFRRKIIPGVIPEYYMPQVQLVMECTNLDVCHFIQYTPPRYENDPHRTLDVKSIPRDKGWFAKYFPVMRNFWDEVLNYRKIGIDKHPNYDKWVKKVEKHKQKTEEALKNKKADVKGAPPPPIISGPLDKFVVNKKITISVNKVKPKYDFDDNY